MLADGGPARLFTATLGPTGADLRPPPSHTHTPPHLTADAFAEQQMAAAQSKVVLNAKDLEGLVPRKPRSRAQLIVIATVPVVLLIAGLVGRLWYLQVGWAAAPHSTHAHSMARTPTGRWGACMMGGGCI